MKSTILLLAAAAGFAQAKPNGMSHMMRDLSRRQAPPNQTVEMIGDLLTVGAVTPVGKQVKTCLEDASGATCVNNDKKVSIRPNFLTLKSTNHARLILHQASLAARNVRKIPAAYGISCQSSWLNFSLNRMELAIPL